VLDLATFLVKNGIDVLLDQWDVDFGDDLPAFMERAIRETDRVLLICTDNYIQKANSGAGGVGYEKTIVTAEMFGDQRNRRKYIPVVRNVQGDNKMPTFLGAAYYIDLSEEKDDADIRAELIKSLYQVSPVKPTLGPSPFLPEAKPNDPKYVHEEATVPNLPSLGGLDRCGVFSDRFAHAFPGGRGTEWFNDIEAITDRLGMLLQSPLEFQEGHLMGWWRGPENIHVEHFEHVEGAHFLMGPEELNISKIAAVNPNSYFRKFVYVEMNSDEPTGLYNSDDENLARQVERFGYANEEYGLVDGRLPITRPEYDDGATIIDGKAVDVTGRVTLRVRYTSSYNFIIAPFNSPLNNSDFDYQFQNYLNQILKGEDVFEQMCAEIQSLPKRN
jgi:hypothetical protein